MKWRWISEEIQKLLIIKYNSNEIKPILCILRNNYALIFPS